MEEKTAPVVVGIHIAPAAQQPMVSLPEVHAVPGRGLEGDRYFAGGGTFTESGRGGGTDVTLMELEALARLRAEYDIDLRPNETRRNIATQGISLDQLIGREFRVG